MPGHGGFSQMRLTAYVLDLTSLFHAKGEVASLLGRFLKTSFTIPKKRLDCARCWKPNHPIVA